MTFINLELFNEARNLKKKSRLITIMLVTQIKSEEKLPILSLIFKIANDWPFREKHSFLAAFLFIIRKYTLQDTAYLYNPTFYE